MTFSAFSARNDGTDFSFDGRDEGAGVLGTFAPSGDSPVATAATLEELERDVRTFLGSEPKESLYLTDCHCRVYRIVINEKYHEAVDEASRRTTISFAILAFSVTSLLGATVGSHGLWALLYLLSVVTLYLLILKWGVLNEVEGALLCEILLVLTMVAIPAISRLTEAPNKAAMINPRPAVELTHGDNSLIFTSGNPRSQSGMTCL